MKREKAKSQPCPTCPIIRAIACALKAKAKRARPKGIPFNATDWAFRMGAATGYEAAAIAIAQFQLDHCPNRPPARK